MTLSRHSPEITRLLKFSRQFLDRQVTRGQLKYDRPGSKRKYQLAFFLSRILGPLPMLMILWLTTAIKSGIGIWRALWVYPLILLFCLGIPVLISSYFIVSKQVESFEWEKISDRLKLAPVVLLALIINLILTYLLTNSTIFHLSLLMAFMIIIALGVMIALNLKISAHIGVASGVFWGINFFTQFKYYWLFLLLIPIVWARLTLKVHTLKELIAGFILSNGLIILAILLFGLPGGS